LGAGIRRACDIVLSVEGVTSRALNNYTTIMFRFGARTFVTTARRAAETAALMEAPNAYGIGVSKAQGVVRGLTGGKQLLFYLLEKKPFNADEQPLETHL